MAQAEGFRNIAARIYTGREAYTNVAVCDSNRHTSSLGTVSINSTASDTGGIDGGQGEAEGRECTESLSSALVGVCRFNHIALRSENRLIYVLLYPLFHVGRVL